MQVIPCCICLFLTFHWARCAAVLSRSIVSNSETPCAVACQAPLSMGFKVRILGWVPISPSRGSSQRRDGTEPSRIVGGFVTVWATREAVLVSAVQQSDSVKHPHVSTFLQILFPSRSLQRIAVLQYLATWFKERIHWERPWCCERLKAGGEGDDRGWDGWMASPALWTWVWASSGRWWRTGKLGGLQSMGLQRVGHDRLNWTELNPVLSVQFSSSLVSDSLWPRELQHARPPCPSPSPGVHPNPCW